MPHPTVRWQRHQRWFYLAFKVALLLGLTVGLFHLMRRVESVFVPLAFAFFVAYQLAPIVEWGRRHRIPPAVTTIGLLVLVVAGVIAFFALFLPRFVGEFAQLAAGLPDYLQSVEATVRPWLRDTLGVDVDLDMTSLGAHLKENAAALLKPTGAVLGSVATGVAGAVAALLGLFLIPVFIFLFSVGYRETVESARQLVPPRHRADLFAVLRRVDVALSSYVRGQLLVMAVLAAFYAVGLLVIGVKFAVFIGVTAGLLNLVPYVGVATGLLLSVLMALLEGGGFGTLAAIGGLFVAGNLLESFVLVPRIVGDRVGLSPLLVLVAVIFWGELLGLLGVLIAVPVTAVLWIVLGELIAAYKRSDFYNRGREDVPALAGGAAQEAPASTAADFPQASGSSTAEAPTASSPVARRRRSR
jgi:predicted PurR-regulated permease PerM